MHFPAGLSFGAHPVFISSELTPKGILTSQVRVSGLCLVGILHHCGDVHYQGKSPTHKQIFLLGSTSFHCLP